MEFLLTLLVVVIVAGFVIWIISAIGLPSPWGRIAQALVAIIVLVYLLSMFTSGGTPSFHFPR